MNLSLYKQMLRTNMKGIMSYGVGSAFYILLILGIYPSIAGNAEDIEKMIKSMPEGFLNAFGFENGLGNLEDFISGEYYGLIFIVILSIFSVMLSTKLLASGWIKGQWPIFCLRRQRAEKWLSPKQPS
ncbi:hypothetical protein B4090_0394 [Bacillus licheniformis]|nr:hypothetical protein B4090_0394 [Bacillus licheniformis]